MTFVSHTAKHSLNHITFLSSPHPLTPSSSHLFTTIHPLFSLHHPLSLHPHIFSPSHPFTLTPSSSHSHSLKLSSLHPLICIPSPSHALFIFSPLPSPFILSSHHPLTLSSLIPSLSPSHPLTLSHTIVHNFLLPKVSPIMPQPAVPLQTVTMFTSVANVELTVICEPHHPG